MDQVEAARDDHVTEHARRAASCTLAGVPGRKARARLWRRRADRTGHVARERHVRAVYQAMACAVMVVDGHGVVREANAAAQNLLGLARDMLLGRTLFEATGPSFREDGSALLVDQRPTGIALATGRAVRDVVFGLTRLDGTRRWIQVDAVPMLEPDGRVRQVVTSFIDVTARKSAEERLRASEQRFRSAAESAHNAITERLRAEEALRESTAELERSNAELQQFAYVASHDLQEPLRTISSYLQLLSRRYRGKVLDETADEFIDYAIEGAGRMQALIRAVLDYSRIGTRGKAFAAVDCNILVGNVVDSLRSAIEGTGARIVCGDLPVVWGDDVQLARLVQNLIGNALKFRRAGDAPEISIVAERADDRWLLRVRDNGIGVAPEHAERIFQMFQRLHTRTEYEGTGIGLAVCRRIVERHGGRIWVESAPGAGATFLFTLPAP